MEENVKNLTELIKFHLDSMKCEFQMFSESMALYEKIIAELVQRIKDNDNEAL